MSLNLPLPPLNQLLSNEQTPVARIDTGFVQFHPRYATWLKRSGFREALDFLERPGEIVCGHPDRHVRRVTLPSQLGARTMFLKVEHVVNRKVKQRNKQAGFGPVSRCEREAFILKALESRNLSGPQWLAYGRGADGRAFLLVESVSPFEELRTVLKDDCWNSRRRLDFAKGLASGLAELHREGFATPDLSVKHVFLDTASGAPLLVDWQSTPMPAVVTSEAAVRMLALLNASTSTKLASRGLRWKFLKTYMKAMSFTVDIKVFAREVLKVTPTLAKRSSVKDQLNSTTDDLRLVWLAGEAVCVRPELVAHWPTPAIASPFYPTNEDKVQGSLLVGLPDGRTATLTRHVTFAPLGRLSAKLKGKVWRSPAATDSRILFQLEKAQVPAPRLLAFGQKLKSFFRSESFTLTDLPPDAEPLTQRLAREFDSPLDKYLFLRNVGRALRTLHDAGARINTAFNADCAMLVLKDSQGECVVVNAPHAVERAKKLNRRDSFADVQHILVSIHRNTSRSERLRVVLGYVDEAGGLPNNWRRAVAKLIRG